MSLIERVLLALSVSLLGCASRDPLPPPEHPLARTPASAAAARTEPPQPIASSAELRDVVVQAATLANGMTILVAPRQHVPYVGLDLVTRGAGTLESPCSPEVLRLTARAIVEAGTSWIDGRVVDPVLVNGQGITFHVGPDHTHFALPVLREALPAVIEVLARTLQKPAFSSSLDLVRLHELDDLSHSSEYVYRILLRLTAAGMYGSSFADQLSPSKLAATREVSKEAVARCHREAFVPDNTALVVVGDVTLDAVRALAEPLFGAWPGTGRKLGSPQGPPPLQPNGVQLHFLPLAGRTEGHVVLLQPAPSQLQPNDELPFALLAELAVGPTRSRSNTRLRHGEGVTYGLQPELIHGRNAGLLVVSAAFETGAITDSVGLLLRTLEELQKKPVPEAELEAAKRRFLHRVALRVGKNQDFAELIGEQFVQGKSSGWIAQLTAATSAIQPAELQRVAAQYLKPDDADVGVYADEALGDELRFLGRVLPYNTKLE